jgi:hypothetical protein
MIHLCQAALERRLMTLGGMQTAYENLAFTPTPGIPYQRVHMMVNRPVDLGLSNDAREDRGIFQVSLFYPLNTGRVESQIRAAQIQGLFKPPLDLTEEGITVLIRNTPYVSSGAPDGDRWHVPVSIYWRTFNAI